MRKQIEGRGKERLCCRRSWLKKAGIGSVFVSVEKAQPFNYVFPRTCNEQHPKDP